MDFNIKDVIERFRKRTENLQPEKNNLKEILQKYIPEIQSSQFLLTKGILSFKNISPTKRTFVKMNKKKIQTAAQEKSIIIRDII